MPSQLAGHVDTYSEHPVSYIAWFDAQAYAAWQNKALPAREQWARAAFGMQGASNMFPWGEEWKADSANVQTTQTWEAKTYKEDVVKGGCYNMAGNVQEWTRSKAGVENDEMPDFGDEMVVCGGSFLQARYLHETGKQAFETRAPDLGFRCVVEIDTAPAAVAAVLQK